MLTPEQIAALRDAAGQLADPINDFLLEDIARRIAGAGQLTGTAQYQVWRAQQLGLSRREIKKRLRALLGVNRRTLKELLTQAAQVGYQFDLKQLPSARALPFEKNQVLQQTAAAAVKLAQKDFTNIVQTLGMVNPYGRALPLQKAYRSCMDYAFKQVATGAADYTTAIRQATRNLADMGVQVIDYESGVHTSIEAAVRRNIMGGLGLMQEQITQQNHDNLGADGWEISAHANSAPDHESIQGRQYSDREYEALNNSLNRRIGTLNCGHAAFPIILGVSQPQYTPEELEKLRADNAKGVTYEGRHYTGYQATQMQRRIERAIRRQKKRILVDEAAGDGEKLQTDQIKLRRLNEEYRRFSRAAGLRTQPERAQAAGFGRGQAARANGQRRPIAAGVMRNTGNEVSYDPKADFSISVDGYNKQTLEGLGSASAQVAKEGGADGKEHLILVDLKNGGLAYQEDGSQTEVGGPGFWTYIREHPDRTFGFVHNHNSDGFFSETDMRTLLYTENINMFVAVRLDGVKYIAEKMATPPRVPLFDMLYQDEIDALTRQLKDGIITAGERTKRREILLVENLLRDYTKGLIELDGRP